MKVGRDPLRKLVKFRGAAKVPQLRLPDQNQLQDLNLSALILEIIRKCSSASGSRFWASSMIRMVRRPLAY